MGRVDFISCAQREDVTLPGSTAQHRRDLLDQHFPGAGDATGQVILRSSGARLDDPANGAAIASTAARVSTVAHVAGVAEPVLSAAGRAGYLDVSFDVGLRDVTLAMTAGVLDAAATPGLEVPPAGTPARPRTDTRRSEALGVGVALILLAFGGLVAAALPLLTAAVTLVCGIGAISLAGHLTGIPAVAWSRPRRRCSLPPSRWPVCRSSRPWAGRPGWSRSRLSCSRRCSGRGSR